MTCTRRCVHGLSSLCPIALVCLARTAGAADLGDRATLSGVVAGAPQRIAAEAPAGDLNEGRTSGPVQLQLGIAAGESGLFFAKVGFAAGDGINELTCFQMSSWIADHQADVVDINGRGRNHLLTAWYRHDFSFSETSSLGLTAGIIDGTDYLDHNAYANCEYTQFMNEALVNGPSSFAPSYDYGSVAELALGDWSINAVGMQVGANDDGNTFGYLGAQVGYHVEPAVGDGNYRVILQASDASFLNATGDRLEPRRALLISADQELGNTFGAWTRTGWQMQRAAVAYAGIYTGGINVSGRLWGREMDSIGLGGGYLTGGNQDLAGTSVVESYLRVALNDALAITGDVQHMRDEMVSGDREGGFVFGLRVVATF